MTMFDTNFQMTCSILNVCTAVNNISFCKLNILICLSCSLILFGSPSIYQNKITVFKMVGNYCHIHSLNNQWLNSSTIDEMTDAQMVSMATLSATTFNGTITMKTNQWNYLTCPYLKGRGKGEKKKKQQQGLKTASNKCLELHNDCQKHGSCNKQQQDLKTASNKCIELHNDCQKHGSCNKQQQGLKTASNKCGELHSNYQKHECCNAQGP